MTEIPGTCDDGFEPVQAAMAANFDSGQELGASVCVTPAGQPVAATVMLMPAGFDPAIAPEHLYDEEAIEHLLERRPPGGSPARTPATTRSPRATLRRESCAASPVARSARSSGRRWPGRSAPTFTSDGGRRTHLRAQQQAGAARSPSSISRRKLTVSYAMNTMASGLVGDLRGAMIVMSAYQALAAQS
ncbi:MAG: hypothetical protein WAT13_06780 [Candidatus Microthrix parvicella]|jgi:hypothetical protein|nr:hypothetical protein [Candidatus Microthrix sp.]